MSGETLGGYLRQTREAANLSLREVAEYADISASHLSLIERGIGRPSQKALESVLSVIGGSLDEAPRDYLTKAEVRWIEDRPELLRYLRRKMVREGGP